MLAPALARTGRATDDGLAAAGQLTRLGARAFIALFRDPQRREVLVLQALRIGWQSLPVALVTGVFMGLVLAVQSYGTLVRFDAETMCGSMSNYAIASQLAPTFTALMFAGRVGSNMAAEIGGFTGIVAPDEKTVDFLVERRGLSRAEAERMIEDLQSDPDAEYAHVIELEASAIRPMVALPGDPGNGIEIAKRSVKEAGQDGLEALMILGLGSRADGPHGSAVEAVEHGDDLVAARLAGHTRQLDGSLDRLRSAVAEEALAAEAAFAQSFGKQSLSLHVPGVRHVDQLGDLLADGFNHARRAMAQQITSPPWKQV